jgi:two-component system sensor histidine kinase/response regulator
VTLENSLGDIGIDTHVEVFEDVLGKILMNAWESYDSLHAAERPIWLRTRLLDKGPEGKFVEMRVDDAGGGIEPDIRDHMFEPFISSKHTVGVGMGLTVARHALRNMGGDLTLVDRPGGGTSALLLHPLEKKKKVIRDA